MICCEIKKKKNIEVHVKVFIINSLRHKEK